MTKLAFLGVLCSAIFVGIQDMRTYHYYLFSEEVVTLRNGEVRIEVRPSFAEKEEGRTTVVANPYSLIITHEPGEGVESVKMNGTSLSYTNHVSVVEIIYMEGAPQDLYFEGGDAKGHYIG